MIHPKNKLSRSYRYWEESWRKGQGKWRRESLLSFSLGIEGFNTAKAYSCYCTLNFSLGDVFWWNISPLVLSGGYVPSLMSETSHKWFGMVLLACLYQTHVGRGHDTTGCLRNNSILPGTLCQSRLARLPLSLITPPTCVTLHFYFVKW